VSEVKHIDPQFIKFSNGYIINYNFILLNSCDKTNTGIRNIRQTKERTQKWAKQSTS
jgi:hypothetical protein